MGNVVLLNRVLALLVGMVVLPCFQREAQGAILEHLVQELPGQPAVNFTQYAGYIPVGQPQAKHLFYWFVEADHNSPSSLPLAFWFNGGQLQLFSSFFLVFFC
jgi:hypothetical protein